LPTFAAQTNWIALKFYSTQHLVPPVGLRQAVLQGLPADNGLFMPEQIPALPAEVLAHLEQFSFAELALAMAQNLLGHDLPAAELRQIVEHTVAFEAPLVRLTDQLHVLELFHGPTLAFKDFGARFMARTMAHLAQGGPPLHILVATSGDTGSAVAHGFLGVPGITVTVLYPKGKVSPFQEMQFTTLGQNITALEIAGTFDDCQALVKTAFLDTDLTQRLNLSSANSINIARLIPQSFYYAWAYVQAKRCYGASLPPVVMVVPSGNFGNLTAGLLAQRMGIPLAQMVAATNANDVVPNYLTTGVYEPRPSVATISNAMDVGSPSNFARLADLFGGSLAQMREAVAGYAFGDGETRQALREVWDKYGYLLDPHAAVGYLAHRAYVHEHGSQVCGIVLGTAHPVKFAEVVEPVVGHPIPVPERLAHLLALPKQSLALGKDYAGFKAFLQKKYL
jgi:threonine synthase